MLFSADSFVASESRSNINAHAVGLEQIEVAARLGQKQPLVPKQPPLHLQGLHWHCLSHRHKMLAKLEWHC